MLCALACTRQECIDTFKALRQCEATGVIDYDMASVIMENCPPAFVFYSKATGGTVATARRDADETGINFGKFMKIITEQKDAIDMAFRSTPKRTFPLTIPAA